MPAIHASVAHARAPDTDETRVGKTQAPCLDQLGAQLVAGILARDAGDNEARGAGTDGRKGRCATGIVGRLVHAKGVTAMIAQRWLMAADKTTVCVPDLFEPCAPRVALYMVPGPRSLVLSHQRPFAAVDEFDQCAHVLARRRLFLQRAACVGQ